MRDLTIHGDDLIVGTHGRSFWVLDDFTSLRQLTEETARAQVLLFKPQEALRWRWNRNPDTPLPPEFPAGQNPPDGAIIDYYLAAAAGEHPIPMYWVRPVQIPSSASGMHRFVWDLRGTPPKALEQEFPISAIIHNTPLNPQGALAPPGIYTVRLTVDGKQYSQSLTVRMDPRIKSSLADLQAQANLESGAVSGMNQSYEALGKVRSLRAQVKELAPKTKRKLADSLGTLDKRCAAFEGATASTFFGTPPSSKQPESLASLNQHFSQILAIADSADAAPTTQVGQVYNELAEQLKKLEHDWEEVKQVAVPALNKELSKAKLPALDPEKPLTQELGSAGDGDDEP